MKSLLTICLLATISSTALAEKLAIVGGKVFTGSEQGTLESATVLINGNEIVSVSASSAVPEGYQSIDASGKYVTPGLIGMKEFGYQIYSFQHGVEAYKIGDLLAENNVCSAMWADWWGFKMEAYDGIRENIPMVHEAGACAIVHSDSDLGIQRLNQEAAKAWSDGRRAGIDISQEEAWIWLSANPAKSLGIFDETGSLEVGKNADLVLWSDNPFSTYARADKVYIDGGLAFDLSDPASWPVADFELGQVGEGDIK